MSIGRFGSVYTISPPEKIHALIQFTIIIDLSTASSGLNSLEKIVGYFINQREMNFFVGQWKDGLSFHLPDEKRNRIIHFGAEGMLEQDKRTTLLVSYDGAKLALLQDGKVRTYRETGPLTFNGWSKEYPLIIGTDADGKAQWKGTIYEIAVYDRPLSQKEIAQLSALNSGKSGKSDKSGNAAGRHMQPQAASRKPRKDVTSDQWPVTSEKDENKRPLVHYVFKPEYTYEAEFRGKKAIGVRDLGKGDAADLVIPEYFMPYKRVYLKWDLDKATVKANWQDTLVNIIGFIPFGFLLFVSFTKSRNGIGHQASGFRIIGRGLSGRKKDKSKGEIAAGLAPLAMTYRGTVSAVVMAVAVGFVVSFAIEYTQAYLPSRDSSLRDLLANTLGTLIGAMGAAWYLRKGFGQMQPQATSHEPQGGKKRDSRASFGCSH